MCKFLICHDMLRSECLLLLNVNFVNSGKERKKANFFNEPSKLYFDLHDKIEEEKFDKNNENLKYLSDVNGNLLQIFEGKDITSYLEINVKFFMSETLCHFCVQKMRTNEILWGRYKIFSSANIPQFGLLKYFCQK